MSRKPHLEATMGETREIRKSVQLKFEKRRGNDLPGYADLRKPRLGRRQKESERGAREAARRSQDPQSSNTCPALDRFGIGTKCFGEMIANARHHQGMSIGNRYQRQRARVGPLPGILRY